MRGWFFFLGIFLLGMGEIKAQAISIFPRERKEALWDSVLIRNKINYSVSQRGEADSCRREKGDSLYIEASYRYNANLGGGRPEVGPRVYRFGALNGSLYERIQGGSNTHLWALQWASDSAFLDSGELIPLVLVDFYGADTLKNILWCTSELDSEIRHFEWIAQALRDTAWRNVAWEERWQQPDSFAYFVLRDYLLPLPCHHESMYLHYAGTDDITLSIDFDFAAGLNLEECLFFMEEHVSHLRAFHLEECLTETPQLTLEVAVRNANIAEIREFMRRVSDWGIRIELVFPWER